MEFKRRIQTLKEGIAKCITSSSNEKNLQELVAVIKTMSVEVNVELEIAFREVLSSLLQKCRNHVVMDSDAHKLIAVALEISPRLIASFTHLGADDPDKLKSSVIVGPIGKIPFLLIEDVLEQQTVAQSQLTWEIVDSLIDKLMLPCYLEKGKLLLLRFCNSLLRKLSKSCHTEFCGRVLMFLTAVYPISEKSAVNLAGKINENNVTAFDPDEVFSKTFEPDLLEDSVIAKSAASEAAAKASKPTEKAEEGEIPEHGSLASGKKNLDINYNLYKTFWGMQKFLSMDNKAIVSKSHWDDVQLHFATILSAFEQLNYSSSELAQSSEHWQAAKEAAANIPAATFVSKSMQVAVNKNVVVAAEDTEFTGCKFLTSPQLFALQLKDPALRRQVLTQIVIFLHSLRTSPISIAAEAPAVKRNSGGKTEVATAAKPFNILDDVSSIESRCFNLLSVTPPNGALYCDALKTLLNREINWLEWKKDLRCIPFEREAEKSGAFDATTIDRIAGTGSQLQQKSKSRVCVASRSQQGPYISGLSEHEISNAVKTILKSVASFEEFISPFVEADDPENGIEEEYHPKNDNVYCWRARRLLAQQKFRVIECMGNGDLSRGLKELHHDTVGSLKDIGVFVEEQEIVDTKSETVENSMDLEGPMESKQEAESKTEEGSRSTTQVVESKSDLQMEIPAEPQSKRTKRDRDAVSEETDTKNPKRPKEKEKDDKVLETEVAIKNDKIHPAAKKDLVEGDSKSSVGTKSGSQSNRNSSKRGK